LPEILETDNEETQNCLYDLQYEKELDQSKEQIASILKDSLMM